MAVVRKRTWESGGVTRQAWVVDYADRQGKRHWKTFRLKRDADAALIKIQGEVQAGTHTPASASITVKEACEIWYKHNVAEGTRSRHPAELSRPPGSLPDPVVGSGAARPFDHATGCRVPG